jgi:putative phosphoribosyl transferase
MATADGEANTGGHCGGRSPITSRIGLYFRDRVDAGRQLATRLETLDRDDLIALGLPRGGVVIASEVATTLGIPLDVVVVRKLGVPFQPELAMGAIGEDGIRVIDHRVVGLAGISDHQIQVVEERERVELARRAQRFRGGRPRLDLRGAAALILDDGIATGSTARAAVEVAKKLGATRVVVAAPVTSVEAVRTLSDVAEQVIYLAAPPGFLAIGEFYADFTPTPDAEVVRLLASSQSGSQGMS